MPCDYQPWDRPTAKKILEEFRPQQDELLPMLHGLQAAFGYIHSEAKVLLADTLNLSLAEVHGVVTFYHDFRSEPPADLVVKLCRAEACQAAGGRAAASALLDHLRLGWSEPAADGTIAVEPIYCLGLCAAAPAALIGEELAAEFDGRGLIARVEAAR